MRYFMLLGNPPFPAVMQPPLFRATRPVLFGIVVALACSATLIRAQTYPVWQGSGTNWNDPANWSLTYGYAQLQWTGGGNATSWANFGSTQSQWRFYFSGSTAYTLGGDNVNFFDFGGANGGMLSDSTALQTIGNNLSFQDSGSRTAFILTRSTGGITFNGGVEAAGNLTALGIGGLNTSGVMTFNGVVSGSRPIVVGTNSLDNNTTSAGNTRVAFAGNNTYTGSTTVNLGALTISHSNALGNTSAGTTVNTGGVLRLSGGVTFASEALTLNGDGISSTGALVNTSGNNTWQGSISNNSGARIGADSGTTLTISGNIANAANQTLYAGGAGNITLSGTLTGDLTTGNGAIYKDGAGVLTLSANNSGLSGLVRLLGGTISITNNNSLGSGILELGGLGTQAILSVGTNTTRSQNLLIQNASTNSVINVAAGSAFTVTGSLTQDGALANTTKFGKSGAGTLILAGASGNTYNGQIQIGESTIIAGTASALGVNSSTTQRGIDLGVNITDVSQTNNVALLASNGVTVGQSVYVAPNTNSALRTIGLSGTGSATFNNEFYMDGILTVDAGSSASDSVTISGNILNTGGISKTNAGILVLSGSGNTFSGGVTLGQGTLRVGNNSALGTGAFTINSGTFASDGAAARTITNGVTMGGNATLGDATGTGALTLSNVNLAQATRTLTVGNNTTIAGVISNGGATAAGLTKAGSGTLTLSGANTYSGGTLVSGGRLVGDTRSLQGVITNNAAVTFDQSTNGTYASALSGTGSLVKSGNGSVTFSGANSYSGGTMVSGGALVGDTRSLQGAITNTAAVTFNQTTNGSYTGLMSGTGGTLTKSGNGTVTLTANNTYTGATTIGGGRLVVNGSQGSSAVTVASGASLGGSGTVGALTVSGLVAPGNSIGTLSAGNTTFNGGGSFELEIFDWVNSPGTGWDLLAVTGNLTLSNTSGSPFAINLVSLQDSSTPGLSTDWNQNVNFTNTFITYSGSLLGTSFASNLFTVNTNSFLNPVNGTFSITSVSNGLALLYTTSFAPSSTYNWNAGSGLWGTAGNWTNGAAPTNGASIIFSGAGGASTNSSTVSSVQGIVFTNGAGAYTVSGTAMSIGAGGISNASSATQTISNNLSLSANAAITAAGGNVTLAGNLTNGGNAVTVGGAANATIGGVISGLGSLVKTGAGSLTLANANAYTGATTISAGTVTAANNASLGATNGSTTVADGATLELSGGVTVAENITITGSGVGGGGAIRSLGNGDNTLGGTITLGGNARINVDAPFGGAVLTGLGSTDLTYYYSDIAWSQSDSSLTLTSPTDAQIFIGDFVSAPLNWSAYQNLGVLMAASGSNNGFSYSIELWDIGLSTQLAIYTGSTAGITSSGGISALTLTAGGEDLSSVGAMWLTWSGGTNNLALTLSNFVALPSSSLVITGNIVGGSNVLTLGAAGASAESAGGNITVNGVISGAGNTNSGTVTSLVKDGPGALNLGGANTYTGDTRIEGGSVVVNAGGSLGVSSDVFLSTNTFLGIRTNVTVSSFQGTDNTATIDVLTGTRLIMNGADKGTVQQNAVIDGFGGVTLAASGNTVLRLSSDNTFKGSTIITGGTLALAGAGTNQALRSTTSITVSNSTGKLLLETSNQVRDTATLTLSGGTLQRGSGVSEVFGNLVVNSASFIDFGTGASGTLSFGTYTPSSLLTIQNFDFGSTMTFRSNLSSSITNTSLFTFQNGGISSYSWNSSTTTFTITAIPEPSTVLAAVGLLGLMLWSQRGSLRRWAASRVR